MRKHTFRWFVVFMFSLPLFIEAQSIATYKRPEVTLKYLAHRALKFNETPVVINHVGIDTATNNGGLFSIYLAGDLLEEADFRNKVQFVLTPTNRGGNPDAKTVVLTPSKDENLYFTEKTEDGFYEFYLEPTFSSDYRIMESAPLDLELKISYEFGGSIKDHKYTKKPLVSVQNIKINSKLIKRVRFDDLPINGSLTPNMFFTANSSQHRSEFLAETKSLVAIHIDNSKVTPLTNVTSPSDGIISKVWEKNKAALGNDLKAHRSLGWVSISEMTAPLLVDANLEANKRLLVLVYSVPDVYLMVYTTSGSLVSATKVTNNRITKDIRMHTLTADNKSVLISSYLGPNNLRMILHDWTKNQDADKANIADFEVKDIVVPQALKYPAISATIGYPGRISINSTSPQNNIGFNKYISTEYDFDGKRVFSLIAHQANSTSVLKYHVKNQLPIYLFNGFFDDDRPEAGSSNPSFIYITGRDEKIEPEKLGKKMNLFYPWLHDLKGTKATFYFVGLKDPGSKPELSPKRNADYNQEVETFRLTYDYITGEPKVREVSKVAGNHYSWYNLDSYTVLDKDSETRGVLNLCQQCIIGKLIQIVIERNNHLSAKNIVDPKDLISTKFPSQALFHENNFVFFGNYRAPLGLESSIYYVNTTADEFIFDGYSLPYYQQAHTIMYNHLRPVNAKYSNVGDLWKYPFYFKAVGDTKGFFSMDDGKSEPISFGAAPTQQYRLNFGLASEHSIVLNSTASAVRIDVPYSGTLSDLHFSQMKFYIKDHDKGSTFNVINFSQSSDPSKNQMTHDKANKKIVLTLTNSQRQYLYNTIKPSYIGASYFTSHSDWMLVLDFGGKKSYMAHVIKR